MSECEMEQVRFYKFFLNLLVHLVTEDGRCTKEIRRRIALGKTAFSKRKELLRGSLSLGLKKRIVKVLVWSVVSYGSETWTLRQEDIRSLEAFEIWIMTTNDEDSLDTACIK